MFEGAWEGKALFRCPPCARFLSIFFELLGSREAHVSHFLGPVQGAGIQGHPWENSLLPLKRSAGPLAAGKLQNPQPVNQHRIRAGKGPFKASSTSPQTFSSINPAECKLPRLHTSHDREVIPFPQNTIGVMCWVQRPGVPGPWLNVRVVSSSLSSSPPWRSGGQERLHGPGGVGACQHEESSKEWLCRGKFGRANLKLWLEPLRCVEGILGQKTAC